MTGDDEFYIGYEPVLPCGIRRIVSRAVVVVLTVVMTGAIVATLSQQQLPAATFEYGKAQTFTGWLSTSPAPMLHVRDGEQSLRYWLVAPGKFGADTLAYLPRQDGPITLTGTRITREHWRMLEVVPGSVRAAQVPVEPPSQFNVTRTRVRLHGEVVDSKCFLGVMNPNAGAAHRDCAVRCLSGGVPRMLAYRDGDGIPHLALLMTPARVPVGTPLSLDGELIVDGDVEVFASEGK